MSSIKSSLMRSSAFVGPAMMPSGSAETRWRDRTKAGKPGYVECSQCGRVAKVLSSGRLWAHRSRHDLPCHGPAGVDLTDLPAPAPDYDRKGPAPVPDFDRKGLRDRKVPSRKVSCPICEAQPGRGCVTAAGLPTGYHPTRRRMALRAGL